MLDRVVIIESIKLVFSSKNKFFDRKDSSLTKYYRIKSKLAFFQINSHVFL